MALSILFSIIENNILLSQLPVLILINLGGEPEILIISSKSESLEIKIILPAFFAFKYISCSHSAILQ